jgi:osmotically-inducible protein OsmY
MNIEQLRRVVENPDAADDDDLKEASRMIIAVYGYEKAVRLLGEPYTVRCLRIVWHYIDLIRAARVHRQYGRIQAAEQVESVAQNVYSRIPEKVKW